MESLGQFDNTTSLYGIIAIASITTILLRILLSCRIVSATDSNEPKKRIIQANLFDVIVLTTGVAIANKWYTSTSYRERVEANTFILLSITTVVFTLFLWHIVQIRDQFTRTLWFIIMLPVAMQAIALAISIDMNRDFSVSLFRDTDTTYIATMATAALGIFVFLASWTKLRVESSLSGLRYEFWGLSLSRIVLAVLVTSFLIANLFIAHSDYVSDRYMPQEFVNTYEYGWPRVYQQKLVDETAFAPDLSQSVRWAPLAVDLVLLCITALAVCFWAFQRIREKASKPESKINQKLNIARGSMVALAVVFHIGLAFVFAYFKTYEERTADRYNSYTVTESQKLPLIESLFFGPHADRVLVFQKKQAPQVLPPVNPFSEVESFSVGKLTEETLSELSLFPNLKVVKFVSSNGDQELLTKILEFPISSLCINFPTSGLVEYDLKGFTGDYLELQTEIDDVEIRIKGLENVTEVRHEKRRYSDSSTSNISIEDAPNLKLFRCVAELDRLDLKLHGTPLLQEVMISDDELRYNNNVLLVNAEIGEHSDSVISFSSHSIPGRIRSKSSTPLTLVCDLRDVVGPLEATCFDQLDCEGEFKITVAGTQQHLHSLLRNAARVPQVSSVSAYLSDVNENLWDGFEALSRVAVIEVLFLDKNLSKDLLRKLLKSTPDNVSYHRSSPQLEE
jgi:hypothetical protein